MSKALDFACYGTLCTLSHPKNDEAVLAMQVCETCWHYNRGFNTQLYLLLVHAQSDATAIQALPVAGQSYQPWVVLTAHVSMVCRRSGYVIW